MVSVKDFWLHVTVCHVKGIVHTKITVLSLFIHVVPNQFKFFVLCSTIGDVFNKVLIVFSMQLQ